MPVQEQDVSRIWADVIGIPEADVDTNFFDLGGHSLLLMELASRLNQQLGIDTDVLVLMEYPTVAKFTAHWNSVEELVDGNR
ncbi:acyl carrier protein [Streptomyces sp. AC627_RSS907]|uniref:acyl carrier protein n=1 Tax=Streptomyces sp. AC627_RSS907 TaxID=2823684 RepID=UPI001C2678A3|nr:acyl carrier protein [Streptomyces sp. AC627_RSS907]